MTDCLLLRPYEPAYFDDFYTTRSRPDVYRYLFADHLDDRAKAEEAFAKKMTQYEVTEEDQWLVLAAYWPEAGRVIGDVVLSWLSEEHRQGEIGYVFNPEFHGKGLAREELKLHRVQAESDVRNEPSWRLMERLKMCREAHFRRSMMVKGEWCDSYVYALLKEEYESA
ncbi:hypothetical protein UK23_14285 [Lentzea aerocolonigenes]|uniref:N-acetyltransferase domain-containing protein n=1 Tax=Lentzea aerocolonigenes TaxID=68170 RepID=A0A0F0H6V3_LENAE|nr:GNAT family protein [Lentzea aerocolonigenes]KJK49353.1 hypothetical protein UK23_14285 [Lentzea aerocolonigenes]